MVLLTGLPAGKAFDPENPDKKALVVDFIREVALDDPEDQNEEDEEYRNADRERYDWLMEVSKTKKEKNNGLNGANI